MKKITLFLMSLFLTIGAMAQEIVTISSEQGLTQQWTSNGQTDETGSYTPWGGIITEYPAGITPSSGNEVHMAETKVDIAELGRLNITFQWTTGEHRLNILGADLINENGEVVYSDYHNGQTGGNNSNNTYTFVATEGSYTLRYIVEHNANGNDLRKTNGNITVTLTDVAAIKDAVKNGIRSFEGVGIFTQENIDIYVNKVEEASVTNVEEFKNIEASSTYLADFYKTIDKKCFTFNSKGRETTNGRYLGVRGINTNGTMDVVATDANELKNIWEFEHAGDNKYRLKNIAYDVYAQTTSESSLAGNTTLQTTASADNAGLFFIKPQENKTVSLGADGGRYSFMHEANWGGHEIVRWEALANGSASQWTAVSVEKPELCSITYNNIYNGEVFETEKLNVEKGTEYQYVNNYSKDGLKFNGTIPATEAITENKVIEYEYISNLPFVPATITNDNRLAQGSKLYKITLRKKSVQLNADGTDFEYSNNGAIENQLFAVVGTPLNDWQMFNYAAGLNKPIWANNNNNNCDFLPTEGVTEKLELVYKNGNVNESSFRKKGTNAYIHDYNGNFAVWNDAGAYKDDGSFIVFTEATDKEISIATLNMDIKAVSTYLTNELVDESIKTKINNIIAEANTAIADANSTAEQLNEIDARVCELSTEAANDLVVANADNFKNNGIYTFKNSRGWLLYNSAKPNVLASSIAYNIETGADKAHCQWAIYKSSTTNCYYMYNLGAGKFIGDSESDGGVVSLVEKPINNVEFRAGTKAGYPIIITTNNKSAINNYNHGGEPGVANWTDGLNKLSDDGSCQVVNKVGIIDDETLATIETLVKEYESQFDITAGYYTIKCGDKYVSDDRISKDSTQRTLTTGDATAKNIFYYDGKALMGYSSGYGFVYACCNTKKPENGMNHFEFKYDFSRKGYLVKSSDGSSTNGWADGFWKANDGNYLERVGENAASIWTLEEVTSLPVTISAAKYATFYAPVAVKIAGGVTAYTATINGNWVTLNKIEGGVIPANTGVVLYAETADTYDFAITTTDAKIESALRGSVATTYYTETGTYYALALDDEAETGVAFCKDEFKNSRFQNNSHKAYLYIADGGAKSIAIRFPGTTAIEEVETEAAETVIYDLTGRRVNEITKAGVYIINGKKILVK